MRRERRAMNRGSRCLLCENNMDVDSPNTAMSRVEILGESETNICARIVLLL